MEATNKSIISNQPLYVYLNVWKLVTSFPKSHICVKFSSIQIGDGDSFLSAFFDEEVLQTFARASYSRICQGFIFTVCARILQIHFHHFKHQPVNQQYMAEVKVILYTFLVLASAQAIELLCVPQGRPIDGFSLNFPNIFTIRLSKVVQFWQVSGSNCYRSNYDFCNL